MWKAKEFLPICEIGKGSFAPVWKALHQTVGKEFAVKQVNVDKTIRHFKGNTNKLFREVEILQGIIHTNVLRYYYCWFEGENVCDGKLQDNYKPLDFEYDEKEPDETNFLYIQMELCDSILKDWITKYSCNLLLPEIKEKRLSEIPNIFIQVSEGLSYLHSINIIHRDLKPDNILCKKSNNYRKDIWKIGDFGLSIQETDLQVEPSIAGAWKYKSPEDENTQKSDVYTLGLIFLEVLNKDFYVNVLFDVSKAKSKIEHEFHTLFDTICSMLKDNQDQRLSSKEVLDNFKNPGSTNIQDVPPKPEIKPFWFEVRKPVGNFSGRKTQLDKLYQTFQQSFIQDCKSLTLVGLGGVGKSELVKNFAANLYKSNEANCLWIECENEQSFASSINRLFSEFQSKFTDKTFSLSKNFQTILKFSLPDLPSLLIFDNLDDIFPAFEDFMRSFRTYEIQDNVPFSIITTRNRNISPTIGGELLELKVLEDNEAIGLVNKSKISIQSDQDCLQLCSALENFPLALQQATTYIRERQKSKTLREFGITQYLDLFEKQKKKTLGHKLSLSEHDYSLTTLTTWNLTFEVIKNNPDLGPLAESILLLWGYVLHNDQERVEPLVQFLEMLAELENDSNAFEEVTKEIQDCEEFSLNEVLTACSAPRNLWKPKKKELIIEDDLDTEIDLEDDSRLCAQALQLIRTYSMCTLEIRYFRFTGLDTQYISMHRLVQEIIRLNQTQQQNINWVKEFSNKLQNPKFRDFSTDSKRKFERMERCIENLCQNIGQCLEILPLFSQIWLDSNLNYLPSLNISVWKNSYTFVRSIPISIYTLLVERNYWFCENYQINDGKYSFKVSTKNALITTSANDDLFQYYTRVVKVLPMFHSLKLEIVGLCINYIIEKETQQLGKNDSDCCKNMIEIFSHMKKLRDITEIDINPIELFAILLGFGRILDFLENNLDLDEIKECCKRLTKMLVEKLVCLRADSKYLSRILKDFINSVLNLDSNIFSDFMRKSSEYEFDEKDLHLMNQALNWRTPIPSTLALPVLEVFLENPKINFYQSTLNCLFQSILKSEKYSALEKLATDAINVIQKLCDINRFVSAERFIKVLIQCERDLWEKDKFEMCQKICQNISQFSKYRTNFDPTSIISDFIDEFSSKVTKAGLEKMFKKSLTYMIPENANTNKSEETSDIVAVNLSVSLSSTANSDAVIFSKLQSLWKQGLYDEWLDQVQNRLKTETNPNKLGYLESKISELTANNLIQLLTYKNVVVSPNVLTWCICFMLDNNGNLENVNGQDLVSSLDFCIFIIMNDENILKELHFPETVADLGKQILENGWNDERKDEFNILQLPNLFYIWYVLISTIEFGKENCYNFTLFNIMFEDEIPEKGCFYIMGTKFRKLIQHSSRATNPVIRAIICMILKCFVRSIEINDMNKTSLISICDTAIEEFLLDFDLNDVVLLCKQIQEICQSFENSNNFFKDISSRYKFQTVAITHSQRRTGGLSDRLRIYRTALKIIPSDETKLIVNEELENILNEMLTVDFFEMENGYTFWDAKYLFLFCLKYGSERLLVKNLIESILDYSFSQKEFNEIYEFGLQISALSKKKVKDCMVPKVLKSMDLVVEYLKDACINYRQRVLDMFKDIDSSKVYDTNFRIEYLARVNPVLENYCVRLGENVISDPEYSDLGFSDEDQIAIIDGDENIDEDLGMD